jgi:hypothetical protein
VVAIYKEIKIKYDLQVFKPVVNDKVLTAKQLKFIIYSDLYQAQINQIIRKIEPLNVKKEYNQYCFAVSDHLYETHSLADFIHLNMKLGLYFKRADRFYSIFHIEDLIIEYINLNKIDFDDSLIADD